MSIRISLGIYFDFMNEAPGPLVETTQALIQSIKEYDYELYKEKCMKPL